MTKTEKIICVLLTISFVINIATFIILGIKL